MSPGHDDRGLSVGTGNASPLARDFHDGYVVPAFLNALDADVRSSIDGDLGELFAAIGTRIREYGAWRAARARYPGWPVILDAKAGVACITMTHLITQRGWSHKLIRLTLHPYSRAGKGEFVCSAGRACITYRIDDVIAAEAQPATQDQIALTKFRRARRAKARS